MKVNNIVYMEHHHRFDRSKRYEVNSEDLSDQDFELFRYLIQRSGILHYAVCKMGPGFSDKQISLIVEALDGSRQVITSDLKPHDEHAELATFVKRLGRTLAS